MEHPWQKAVVAITLFVTAMASFGFSSSLPAWVFYFDDRRPAHLSTVGTLEVDLPEGRAVGTAVLVDECGILTNAHIAFGPWHVTALRPPSRSFDGIFTLTEVWLTDGTHPTARATPVVWGDARGLEQLTRPGEDWAYLVLDNCLGRQHGSLDLARGGTSAARGEDDFVAIGYSTGRQMIDPACGIYGERSDEGAGWLHDCAVLSGDSGGPILRRDTNQVAAIARGVFDYGKCQARASRGFKALLTESDGLCGNLAVPVTPEMINVVHGAGMQVGVQRFLLQLGYDAGRLGAIDEAAAAAAIRRFGLPVTGEPSQSLYNILCLRLKVA